MICAGESVRLILTWLMYHDGPPILRLERTLKLRFLVLALLVFRVPAPMVQTKGDNSQTETSNILCVVGVTGLPVPVRFQKSITLAQAIKQAGIAREGEFTNNLAEALEAVTSARKAA